MEAILRTQPTAEGQRHSKIFQLVRRLKAIPELASQPADNLMALFKEWHQRAQEIIRTKDFATSWADFQFAWEECQYAWGANPMSKFFGNAMQSSDDKHDHAFR
jgi:hypothetical protein